MPANGINLTRDDILNADDSQKEQVHVKQWGGDVFVRVMTGENRDHFEEECRRRTGTGTINYEGMKALLIVLTVVDEDSKPLFTEDDIAELNKKNGAAIDFLFQEALRVNAIGQQQLEEIAGN